MNKVIFVYTQRHFKSFVENYRFKSNSCDGSSEIVYLEDRLQGNLLNRILHTPGWLRALRPVFRNLLLEDAVIIFSNGEGLLLNNLDRLIDLTSHRVILLQHGYFNTKEIINSKSKLKVALDALLKYSIGYTPFGAFFGQVKNVDYHVFGKEYEHFLVKIGHNSSRVRTSYGSFIKSDLRCYIDYRNEECLFYDQVLSSLREISESEEIHIYKEVLSKLLERYKVIYFKPHPKRHNISEFRDIYGLEVIGADFEGISARMDCVSFFSTALIEAYFLGNSIMPLKVPGLGDSYWDHFTSSCGFDEIVSYQARNTSIKEGQIEI